MLLGRSEPCEHILIPLQLLNRKPPFGQELLATVNQLPQYTITITESYISTQDDGVEVTLSMECGLVRDIKPSKAKKAKKQKRWDMTLVLTLTSDHTFIDFRRISCVPGSDMLSAQFHN